MPRSTNLSVATMGIDIGKNSFHVVGLDQRGAIRRAPAMDAQPDPSPAGEHVTLLDRHGGLCRAPHLSHRLHLLGHDARLMPAKYVKPYRKGQKNDFRDAEAIAEAVQRPP